jgi:hypothetical protein
MAKAILEDQALDYSKEFFVELSFTDADGTKRRVEKVTHPLKSMVKNMSERGVQAPWDGEVRS